MKPLFTYPFAKPSLVHHLLFIVLCCLFLFLQACSEPNATSKHTKDSEVLVQAPTALKVREGFVNPIGYYENKPRFSWQISAQSATQRQTAYQVQVASSTNFSEPALLWDSQKTVSEQNAWIRYQGNKLQSRQKYIGACVFGIKTSKFQLGAKPIALKWALLIMTIGKPSG